MYFIFLNLIFNFQFSECTPDKRNVIYLQANLSPNLQNLPIKNAIKFDVVLLNKGKGYDAKTGVFTAPEDGVYSFAWSFLSNKGGMCGICFFIVNQSFIVP